MDEHNQEQENNITVSLISKFLLCYFVFELSIINSTDKIQQQILPTNVNWKNKQVKIHTFYITINKLSTNIIETIAIDRIKEKERKMNSKSLDNLSLLTVTNSEYSDWWSLSLKPSLELFWIKKYLNLTIITESPENTKNSSAQQVFINSVNSLSYAQTKIENPTPEELFGRVGHVKQQLHMFEADLYTDKKFVGFVDSDTLFVVPVIPKSVFNNGKPIVRGVRGRPIMGKFTRPRDFWMEVPGNTKKVLGFDEIGGFMTYFPVVIEAAHLRGLREFLENRFDKSFREIFRDDIKCRGGRFSQFNIMMNYVFHFHRKDYDFRVYDPFGEEEEEVLIPGLMNLTESNKILSYNERYPIYHVATHFKWAFQRMRKPKCNELALNSMLKDGVCFAFDHGGRKISLTKQLLYGNSELSTLTKRLYYEKLNCENRMMVINTTIFEPMFNFQDGDRINCSFYDCSKMQQKYTDELSDFKFEFDVNVLKNLIDLEDKNCWRPNHV